MHLCIRMLHLASLQLQLQAHLHDGLFCFQQLQDLRDWTRPCQHTESSDSNRTRLSAQSQEQHSQTMGIILAAATMSMPMATTRISRSCMFLVWEVSKSDAGCALNDRAANPADAFTQLGCRGCQGCICGQTCPAADNMQAWPCCSLHRRLRLVAKLRAAVELMMLRE